MIPRTLLRGNPIEFDDVRAGDLIDTWDPERGVRSRFHRRLDQTVIRKGLSCDLYTDYDMICEHLGLWIQLVHRHPEPTP